MFVLLLNLLSCSPRMGMFCTREVRPVCGNGTTYNNLCLAQSAGFYGDCAHFVTQGECRTRQTTERTSRITCEGTQVLSETGTCVEKPWDDFVSCYLEKQQGACSNGRNPNVWVIEHCSTTCDANTRSFRTHDG